jgi:hypothetical protein
MAYNPVIGRWRKQPGETLRYEVDWTKWLLPGEYLLSAFVDVVTKNTTLPLMEITDPFFMENASGAQGPYGCVFFARGGADGLEYQITHRVTTSSGQVPIREIFIVVEEV